MKPGDPRRPSELAGGEPVAVIGAGVIGAAWAARFALHGHPVRVVDPAPMAGGVLEAVLANACRAWDELGLVSCPAPVDLVASVAEAVDGVTHVQESAPEDLDVKRAVLAEIAAHAPAGVVIASSTSGLRPSLLQAGLRHPERLVVGHPFNPVYLMPLVEVCAGELTDPAAVHTAMATYRSVSMHPLHVRVEIDAFIADRLMEALWREALWLIEDGVATTAEIDEAMTFGFGLRWAQMGLFETYRIAGGEGGMAHFLRQFGPALAWPWSRLTDVPELDEELIATITRQEAERPDGADVRELERRRDRNLVALLRALESTGAGPGSLLAEQRRRLGRSVPPGGDA